MLSRSWLSASALLTFAGVCVAVEPAPIAPRPTPVAGNPTIIPVAGPVTTGTFSSQTSPLISSAEHSTCSCDGCCGPDECGQSSFWFKTDALLGWIGAQRLPPLVTTSPAGTPAAQAGVLGSPGSVVIGGKVNGDDRVGARIESGYLFDPTWGCGIEIGALVLESQAALPSVTSTGTPILARPFNDASTNLQNSVLVAFPGTSSGSVAVRARSGNLYEAHLDFSETFIQCRDFRIDTLLGWRFFRLDDSLRVAQTLFPTGANFVPGTRIDAVDAFGTHNTFNGIDLGLRTHYQRNALSVDLLTKVAVGRLERFENVQGSTLVTAPGSGPTASTGGLLALSSNIGGHGSREYTLFPEFGGTVSYRLSQNWKLSLGYSIFLLDSIARAGDQVNFNVNPNLFPAATGTGGPNQPAFNPGRADVWTQTLSLGAEMSF